MSPFKLGFLFLKEKKSSNFPIVFRGRNLKRWNSRAINIVSERALDNQVREIIHDTYNREKAGTMRERKFNSFQTQTLTPV